MSGPAPDLSAPESPPPYASSSHASDELRVRGRRSRLSSVGTSEDGMAQLLEALDGVKFQKSTHAALLDASSSHSERDTRRSSRTSIPLAHYWEAFEAPAPPHRFTSKIPSKADSSRNWREKTEAKKNYNRSGNIINFSGSKSPDGDKEEKDKWNEVRQQRGCRMSLKILIFVDPVTGYLVFEIHGVLFAQNEFYGNDEYVTDEYMRMLGEKGIFKATNEYDRDLLNFLRKYMPSNSRTATQKPSGEKYKDCWDWAYRWRFQWIKHAEIFDIKEMEFYRIVRTRFLQAGVEEWASEWMCDGPPYYISPRWLFLQLKEITGGTTPLISADEKGFIRSFTLYFTTNQPYQLRDTPKKNALSSNQT